MTETKFKQIVIDSGYPETFTSYGKPTIVYGLTEDGKTYRLINGFWELLTIKGDQ